MKQLKNKGLFAFILSTMVFAFSNGDIYDTMHSVGNSTLTCMYKFNKDNPYYLATVGKIGVSGYCLAKLGTYTYKKFFGNHDYDWVWRWHNNPIEQTSLYHLSNNQPNKNSVFTLFSHGVGTDPGAGTLYKIRNNLPTNSDFYGFIYNDQRPLYFPFPSPHHTNFAQADDIECLKMAYSDSYDLIYNNNNQYQKTIVYGVSRGATTILTILANIDDDENAKKFLEIVDAFILEAPFASMDDITKNISTITKKICYPLSWITKKLDGLSQDSVHNIIDKIFKSYDKDGMSAWDAIDKIYK